MFHFFPTSLCNYLIDYLIDDFTIKSDIITGFNFRYAKKLLSSKSSKVERTYQLKRFKIKCLPFFIVENHIFVRAYLI